MLQIRKHVWEIIGWIGAFFALLAFSLNSFEIVGSQSWLYLGLYSLGCLLMAIYGFSKKAPASWVLNLIFLLLGVIAPFKGLPLVIFHCREYQLKKSRQYGEVTQVAQKAGVK